MYLFRTVQETYTNNDKVMREDGAWHENEREKKHTHTEKEIEKQIVALSEKSLRKTLCKIKVSILCLSALTGNPCPHTHTHTNTHAHTGTGTGTDARRQEHQHTGTSVHLCKQTNINIIYTYIYQAVFREKKGKNYHLLVSLVWTYLFDIFAFSNTQPHITARGHTDTHTHTHTHLYTHTTQTLVRYSHSFTNTIATPLFFRHNAQRILDSKRTVRSKSMAKGGEDRDGTLIHVRIVYQHNKVACAVAVAVCLLLLPIRRALVRCCYWCLFDATTLLSNIMDLSYATFSAIAHTTINAHSIFELKLNLPCFQVLIQFMCKAKKL